MDIKISKKAEKQLKRVMSRCDCSYSSAIIFISEIARIKLQGK